MKGAALVFLVALLLTMSAEVAPSLASSSKPARKTLGHPEDVVVGLDASELCMHQCLLPEAFFYFLQCPA
ncbi:hypothetical protein M6B38_128055 [Iris pallida]|uniref:Uncharacterized protein n=1 Tax=Iris pallida TaxID=29817 RepID=A0AAX6G559_IRIPA|nr:hypothetical protein M6B38_128055 [Iris pallida]